MVRQRRRRRRGAGGSALLEMVLLIPFLAFLMGVTYFFGWSMGNVMHVRESSRYSAWRHARTDQRVEGGRLNAVFYEGAARDIEMSRGLGTDATINDLINAAGTYGGLHEEFADAVIWNNCQQGRSVRVKARFPSDVGVFNHFQGRILGYHSRDGKQWRREDGLTPEMEVTDVFLEDLDRQLQALEAGGSRLARTMRVTYRNKWGGWPH